MYIVASHVCNATHIIPTCVLSIQCHLKNVIQTLIAHQCSWRTRKATHFQHSFGNGPTATSSSYPPSIIESVTPLAVTGDRDDGPPSENSTSGLVDVASVSHSEAELAMMTSRGAPAQQMKPLTLFHLRDALMVRPVSLSAAT